MHTRGSNEGHDHVTCKRFGRSPMSPCVCAYIYIYICVCIDTTTLQLFSASLPMQKQKKQQHVLSCLKPVKSQCPSLADNYTNSWEE